MGTYRGSMELGMAAKTVARTYKMFHDDDALIRGLADRLRVSQAEIIRRAVRAYKPIEVAPVAKQDEEVEYDLGF